MILCLTEGGGRGVSGELVSCCLFSMSLLQLVEVLGRGSVVAQGSLQGLLFGGTELTGRDLVLEGLLTGLLGRRCIA